MRYQFSSDCGFRTRFRLLWFIHRHTCGVCL